MKDLGLHMEQNLDLVEPSKAAWIPPAHQRNNHQ